jgi:mRNA-degrading endonuclease YafQ of YafQ-DinJ toxin-antitoxin module
MEIAFSKSFKRSFKNKIKSTLSEPDFWFKLDLFISDPFEPRLRTHKLSGKLKELWSFFLEYDLRVVFYFT